MSETPGMEGGGGLGTAGSICAISPSDMAGTIGNLIGRIENLEFQLSQIVGANLHTEQLSNISQQVGWVYGVEYMGIPGWTRTEAGTLIPPTGSGIHFQLTRDGWGWYDTSGNLLFGGASGAATMSGTNVDAWNTAAANAAGDYYVWRSDGTVDPVPVQTGGRGVTLISSANMHTGFADEPINSISFLIATAGVYLLSIYAHGQISGTTGSPIIYLSLAADVYQGGHVQFNPAHQTFPLDQTETVKATGTWTGIVRASAGDTVLLLANVGASGGTVAQRYLNDFRGSVIQLTAL